MTAGAEATRAADRHRRHGTALLIVDMQVGMFAQEPSVHRAEKLLATVADLLARARSAGVPVAHVQHAGAAGHCLEEGTDGHAPHPVVRPAAEETVVCKRISDPFSDTDLHARLNGLQVRRLVVAGLQTEFCVDSTCRRAAALGYEVVLVSDAHSTWDSEVLTAEEIIRHHNDLLGALFVELRTARELEL